MNSSAQKKTNIFYLIFIFLLMVLLAILTYTWSAKRTELNNCTNKNLMLQSDLEGMNQMLEGYVGNISSDLKKDLKKKTRALLLLNLLQLQQLKQKLMPLSLKQKLMPLPLLSLKQKLMLLLLLLK